MKYYAKVIELNNDIDEEVLLSFGELELNCFITSCPYKINVGDIYLVNIDLTFLDSEVIKHQCSNEFALDRLEDSFSYEVKGFKINDKIIVNSLTFCDEIYAREFEYINLEFISMKPDRISVEFL